MPAPSRGGHAALRKKNARVRAAKACAYALLGQGVAALREGCFRRSGEVHQWMYALACADQAGFADVGVRAADESAIEGFPRYRLETADGLPRKPDSLCVEGRKPRA
jgi:hypothetical protein